MPNNKKNGVIYTPSIISKRVIEYIKIPNKRIKICDTSCGHGALIFELLYKFKIQKKLDYIINIDLFDIDRESLNKTKEKMDIEFGDIVCNYRNENFLESSSKYDLIIQNPPYISYSDQTKTERKRYLNIFNLKNKPDFYTYFMEKSMSSINKKGMIASIIPNKFHSNKSSLNTFKKYCEGKLDVYDFRLNEVFPDAKIQTAIYIYEEGISGLSYYTWKKNRFKEKKKHSLLNKSAKYSNTKFSVVTGVATLSDEVFIKDKKTDVFRIPAYKGSKEGLPEWTLDIYSNGAVKNWGNICSKTKVYLLNNREKLEERKFHGKWYSFGRNQAVSTIAKKKIIVPLYTTSPQAFIVGEDTIAYSCVIITSNNDNISELQSLMIDLNSSRFKKFIVNKSDIKLKGNYYKISSLLIKDYITNYYK